MEMTFILPLLTLWIAIPCSYTYPTGAPNTACSEMTPFHYGSSAQTTSTPFSIDKSTLYYSGNSTITVTLKAPCGKTFKGFMLQARRAFSNQDQSVALGSFSAPKGSKIVTCGSGQAVTHNDRNQKASMSFVWTAPAQPTGHIVFVATFVEDFNTYWVKVNSSMLLDSSSLAFNGTISAEYPTPLACATTKPPFSQPTTKTRRTTTTTTTNAWWTTRTASRPWWHSTAMKPSVLPDAACGVSKGCFSDCRSGQCSFLVTWAYQSQTNDILFEIHAKMEQSDNRWMAIGFSNDSKMGNDSVAECVSYQGQINVYSSFNDHKFNRRLPGVYQGVVKVGGSFVDGIFKCSFRRQISSHDPEFFDSFDDRYFLFATGKTQALSNAKQMHDKMPISTYTKINVFGVQNLQAIIRSSGKANSMGVLPMLLAAFVWTVGRFFL